MIEHTRLYVGGHWVPASGPVREVLNPATEQVIGHVPDATDADVDHAVTQAARAFVPWSSATAEDRARFLRRLHTELTNRADELAAVINAELGAPLDLAADVHVDYPLAVLDTIIDLLPTYPFEHRVGDSLVVREPAGVVAAITPWNFPLHQALAKLAAALAAGCTVVLKPAELTPLTAFVLAEAVHAAGLPEGVFNLVPGPGRQIGERLATHPLVDMVSFTGSTAVGRRLGELTAPTVKRLALELGGKSASVVLADIDDDLLTTAVHTTVESCFFNSGQACSALTRLIVPRSRLAAVHDHIRAVMDLYRPGADLGPLVSATQRDRVNEHITTAIAQGTRVAAGGPAAFGLPERGYHVTPIVFTDVHPRAPIAQEEIFGPVLAVIPHDGGDEQALAIANDSPYGLGGAVWSSDTTHALAIARRIRTGQVDINGAIAGPGIPFGGYKQSGIGRELGLTGIEEFTEIKAIQLPPDNDQPVDTPPQPAHTPHPAEPPN